jgi:hydrogenase maturation protease
MSSRSAPDRNPARILVYGYGNPGRQDEGVGVVLVEELAKWAQPQGRPWLTFDSNYQLSVEDALAAAEHDMVIFVDAARVQTEGYCLRALHASPTVAFTTHAMSPESVIELAGQLFGARPAAYLLTIKGYKWGLQGTLSAEARKNLQEAKAFLIPFLACPITARPSLPNKAH